jgi:hypothetical protein
MNPTCSFGGPSIILTFSHIVRREKKQSHRDRRRQLNVVLVSYRGEDGNEYRKAFESYEEPEIPRFGENRALTLLQKQW